MRTKWASKEARESARTLTTALSLEETCLRAVPQYFKDDREPTEILGEIFTALRRTYPDEYMVAFKGAVNRPKRGCKDCGEPTGYRGGRGYCAKHYEIHREAGDFDLG